MSIAITAPQKFDFQDLVCVELMLRFHSRREATLLAEPDGGEDAELAIGRDGARVVIEVQVKGAEVPFSLADVASWLAHAPPHRAEGTRLERLLADPGRSALVVASGRADDASSALLGARGWRGERRPSAGVETARAFRAAFAGARVGGKDGGKLSEARLAHNSALASSADEAAVRDALGRVVILERTDAATLDAACQEALRRDHAIPSDRTAGVLLALRECVATAKGKGVDALPVMRRILGEAAPDPIRPAGYVRRGDEVELFEALSRDCVLLLSGTPRVGKSQAARWVAAEFSALGHDVREFSDVARAGRFLLDPGEVPRLALVDNPLGGSQASTDATRSLGHLDALVRRVAPNRKLLVAQGLAPLLATAGATSLDEVRTGQHRWRDVAPRTDVPGRPLGRARILAGRGRGGPRAGGRRDSRRRPRPRTRLPRALGRLLAQAPRPALAGRRRPPRPGGRRPARPSDGRRGVRRPGPAPLGVDVAGRTDPPDGSRLRLRERRVRPAEPLRRLRHDGDVRRPPSPAPPRASLRLGAGLRGPGRRRPGRPGAEAPGHGRRAGTNSVRHPFYRAAAETLLVAPTLLTARRVERAVERGLFCLAPRTSRATARNLDWAYERLGARPAQRAALASHAVDGLRCAFPATRDLCFRFLVRRSAELPTELRGALPDCIASVTSVAIEDLDWTDREARLPVDRHLSGDLLERAFKGVGRDEVTRELASLEGAEGTVSPEGTAAALRFFAHSPEALSTRAVARLLSFDEAVLRAEAGRIWLSRPREVAADDEVLGRIFADDHPSCALAALRGAIEGWDDRDLTRGTRLLDGLGSLARRAAAAMFGQLLLFDRVEHTGMHPPWPVFERLLPVALAALPADAAFVEARLPSVLESALEVLPASSIAAVCEAWIGWLGRVEGAGLLADEFSLAVAELLLRSTADQPALRGDAAARLLSFAGTGARATFVAALVDRWPALRPDEREAVLRSLDAGRSDDRWVQAVALTREAIPGEVAALALANGPDPAGSPELLVDAAPPPLVEAAIRVHVGRPAILRSLGLQRAGREVWGRVVEHVAHRPGHPLFELCWWHVARGADDDRVARMVVDADPVAAGRVLEVLLHVAATHGGKRMPRAWAALLRLAADPEERGRWLDRLAEASPAIVHDVADLRSWLTEADDLGGVLARLRGGHALVTLSSLLPAPSGDPAEDGLPEVAIEAIEAILSEMPPRLPGTCDRLIGRLRHVPDASALVERLRETRIAVHAATEAIRGRMEPPEATPTGWVDP